MPRRLRPEEEALWRRVAENARPLHRERPLARGSAPAAQPPLPDPPPKPRVQSFRLGEAPAPPTATPPKVTAPPLRIDRRTQKDLSRGKRSPEASIDLHGMTLAVAHPALTRFILASFATGRRLVLVITGKGKGSDADWHGSRGVLRRQVPEWLVGPPLSSVVQEILPAHRSHGGAGAFYVILRRG